jgi:hypothetical protein
MPSQPTASDESVSEFLVSLAFSRCLFLGYSTFLQENGSIQIFYGYELSHPAHGYIMNWNERWFKGI